MENKENKNTDNTNLENLEENISLAASSDHHATQSNPVDHLLAKNYSPPLETLHDVPLNVSVELGRTKLKVQDLLQLGQGSVIELEKLAGEPLEILFNNKMVSRGEVVVINEKYGIRLTDIINSNESTVDKSKN